MSKPSIEEILVIRPNLRPRIYAYSIADQAHAGCLKVGLQTVPEGSRVASGSRSGMVIGFGMAAGIGKGYEQVTE